MSDKSTKPSHELAGDNLIELARKKSSAIEPAPMEEARSRHRGLLQKIGKLKPLLPILAGGLRMVDHGAVQAIAELLHVANGSNAAQAANDELHQELADIQTSHREMLLHVQDQTIGIKRMEEQIVRLRETVERNATEHAELVADVKSLGNLIRSIGAGVAILLVVLIVLTSLLLVHRG